MSTANSRNYQKNLKGEFVQTKEQLRGFASTFRGKLNRVFHNAIYGMEVTMGEADALKMAANPRVAHVEQVSVIRAIQQSPATWGIDRIDQRDLPLDNTYDPGAADGTGVTAYIIDTGVQVSHDEFNNPSGQSRASWGTNTSGDGQDEDCHGHGTHVAGTVGGLQYGVAKNVNIIAVKVLQCNGSGSTAGVVAGVEWAMNHAANNGISNKAVANMSLGGGFSSASNTAVRNLHNSGVLTAVAAGNDNANACNYSPASEPVAVTVGSTTSTDSRSSFSNYGSCLDIFAPGSSITAAWIGSNSATRTISGTSMASPHVAGGLAVTISAGSTNAESDVINAATTGKVTNPQSNSPNKLLYVNAISAPTPTPPTPTPPTPTPPTGCSSGELAVDISVTTDGYPGELAWTVGGYSSVPFSTPYQTYDQQLCLDESVCHEFKITDTYGDGIVVGEGDFSLKVNGETKLSLGNGFTTEMSAQFGDCDDDNDPPCGDSRNSRFKINLKTDEYGYETSFAVRKRRNNGRFRRVVFSGDGFGDNDEYNLSKCLRKNNCYRLEVYDSAQDGLCCQYGQGSFQGSWDGQAVPNEDTVFDDAEAYSLPFGNCS